MPPMPVILTQPELRLAPLVAGLQAAGFVPVHWPMSRLAPEPDLDGMRLLDHLKDCDWAMLPSPGAIAVVMSALAGHSLAWPQGCRIALIGPGSRQALHHWYDRVPGLEAATVVAPSVAPFDAQSLLALPVFTDLGGQVVVVLRREDGRQAWLKTLQSRGAILRALTVYRMAPLSPPSDARDWLARQADADATLAVSIASADAGHRLLEAVGSWPQAAWLKRQPVLTQHPAIADALRRDGWAHVIEHPPGLDGLLGALESLRTSKP